MSSENVNVSKKKIIVGAGVSGATAARELIKSGINPKDILVLEMNNYVGGKLKTYSLPTNPEIKTEYGAGVLVQNYPAVDVMYEKGIKLEQLVRGDHTTLDFYKEIISKSLFGMFTYSLNFAWQQVKFAKHVWSFNRICNEMRAKLPADYEIPFEQFSEKNGLKKINTFLQWLVPGFGYGSLHDKTNYAYRMFNYMGYATMLGICTGSLVAVHGGYQQLVEKMLEGIDVKTSAHIKNIDRKNGMVNVQYEQNGKLNSVEGDMLILANSPYYWTDLNMKLSPAEQKCVDHLTYYRYPVAICRIKGLPPKQIFIPDAMKPEGFGHAAFLFTRDKRKDTSEKCDLLSVSSPPTKDTLQTLHIQSNTAYVCYADQLYWINKANNICTKIDLDKEKIAQFKRSLVPTNKARTLSEKELNEITAITGHSTDGRLFTVYINLPAGKNDFSLDPGSKDRETIINDLKKLPGVTAVYIDDAIVWKDYNPSVPYRDSIKLQKEELKHANNTLHVGAYRHDSFETVAATGANAEKGVKRWFNIHQSKLAEVKKDLIRTFHFFALPRLKPYQDKNDKNDKKTRSLVDVNLPQPLVSR